MFVAYLIVIVAIALAKIRKKQLCSDFPKMAVCVISGLLQYHERTGFLPKIIEFVQNIFWLMIFKPFQLIIEKTEEHREALRN